MSLVVIVKLWNILRVGVTNSKGFWRAKSSIQGFEHLYRVIVKRKVLE